MADNEGNDEPAAPRGNEWEVVQLTASAYAAAPGPEQDATSDAENSNLVGENEAETSRLMFMSGHFVFPPSQHENLPLEPESNEIHGVHESEDDVRQLLADEEFEESKALPGVDLVHKDQCLYNSATLSSIHSEHTIGGSATVEDSLGTIDVTEPYDQDEDSVDSNFPEYTDKSFDGCNLPCGVWWKRRAASLYAHAKEADTFWSLFIAAAVMGLVIFGQSWQHERWQVLQLKWHSVSDERMGRMLGPLTRFKDVIVGGHRRGSSIRGSD